ncbi:MAG: hypothetical protein VXY92_01495 [Planctomycetota bacterium]|nr:hypothetical protein [Planctomycetota bacterium]
MHQIIQDAVSYLHAYQTMDLFDSLGLALSEVAHGRFRRYDRVLAEALFLKGRVDAAIRLQERRLGWDRARDAQARLRRYRAVERRLAEASERAR